MKALPLSVLCSVLVLSSSFAQGSGLTIEFDEDTPASERQAFVEAYKHQQDLNRSRRSQATRTIQSNGLSQSQIREERPQESNTFGGSIAKRMRLNNERKEAEIQYLKDKAINERIMAENGDRQGLANSQQELSNRETAEKLRQIQNTQRQIQNRQRGTGY